jgi:hypothetical protein
MISIEKSKKVVGVGLAVVALSMSGAGAATAAPQPKPPPAPRASGIPCFPGTSQAFTVDVFTVVDKEKVTTTTKANGDVVIVTTGKLVLRFKSNTTGKDVVKDVSGSTTEIDHTDGSILFTGTGSNWFGIGPNGQIATGEPGLVFTRGEVALTVVNGTVATFALKGRQQNGCAILSEQRKTHT